MQVQADHEAAVKGKNGELERSVTELKRERAAAADAHRGGGGRAHGAAPPQGERLVGRFLRTQPGEHLFMSRLATIPCTHTCPLLAPWEKRRQGD